MTIAEDIIDFLEASGIGRKRETLFTSAQQGAYDNRPLAAVIHEARSADAPDVTVNADKCLVNIEAWGKYGEKGENDAYLFAYRIYSALRLVLHETINGTEYLCIQAQNPPSHEGYDDQGRTYYSVIVSIFRVLPESD